MLRGSLLRKIKSRGGPRERLFCLQEDGATICFEGGFRHARSQQSCECQRWGSSPGGLGTLGHILHSFELQGGVGTWAVPQTHLWGPGHELGPRSPSRTQTPAQDPDPNKGPSPQSGTWTPAQNLDPNPGSRPPPRSPTWDPDPSPGPRPPSRTQDPILGPRPQSRTQLPTWIPTWDLDPHQGPRHHPSTQIPIQDPEPHPGPRPQFRTSPPV